MSFKILSCDGGGIRGLITALLIKDLDKDFDIVKKADGFAGTSVGGLIALSLAHGKTIDEVIKLFEDDCEKIFEPNTGRSSADLADLEILQGLSTPAGKGPGIFGPQYINDGLKNLAVDTFGDTLLSGAKSGLATVETVRLWDDGSWTPCTFSNLTGNSYCGVSMVDATVATAAAPAYFPPYRVKDGTKDLGYFADGGVFANNPSVSAISEAILGRKTDLDGVRVLSLGTGDSPQGLSPSEIGDPMKWGGLKWTSTHTLLRLALDCSAKAATHHARQLLGNHYARGNFQLDPNIALDDCQGKQDLKRQTAEYITKPGWLAVREWTSQNWS